MWATHARYILWIMNPLARGTARLRTSSPRQVGDLNSCASQLDHGFTMSDEEFYGSQWSMWIRGMLGLDSPDPPRYRTREHLPPRG